MDSFEMLSVKVTHGERSLAAIADSLVENTVSFENTETLPQIADIGVGTVNIKGRDLPKNLRTWLD